jgi:hypothetical protein
LERKEGDDRLEVVLHPVLELAENDLGKGLLPGMFCRRLSRFPFGFLPQQGNPEDVGHGGQEDHVTLVEGARLLCIDLQHAPGAPIDPHRHVQDRDDAVLAQDR